MGGRKKSGGNDKTFVLEKTIVERKRIGDCTFDVKYSCVEGNEEMVISDYKLGVTGITLDQGKEFARRLEVLLTEFYIESGEINKTKHEAQKEEEFLKTVITG